MTRELILSILIGWTIVYAYCHIVVAKTQSLFFLMMSVLSIKLGLPVSGIAITTILVREENFNGATISLVLTSIWIGLLSLAYAGQKFSKDKDSKEK